MLDYIKIECANLLSNETVEEAWPASWIGGLVPPSTMETAAKCPDGVARVEGGWQHLVGRRGDPKVAPELP